MGAVRKATAVMSSLALGVGGAALLGTSPAEAASAVATTTVNIRSGPGTSYAVVGGLVRGQHITPMGAARAGWVKVRFERSVAYVAADYLDLSGRTAPASIVKVSAGTMITTAVLNVRTGPGLSYRVVTRIKDGSAVTITGRSSKGFAETVVGGQKRWVSGQYLARSTASVAARTTGRLALEDLRIRTAPSGSGKVVTTIRRGAALQVTGATQNGYAQIVYSGRVRWAAARYLGNAADVFPSAPVSSSGDASTRQGEIAVAFAQQQLGEPYRFGATGPSSWDCSGLVQAAWARAGVRIPRTTYTQFKIGTRIARSQLRAGDLVFFYGSNPSHVGIYVGDGKMINAPRPGKRVEYQSLDYMPYAGAVRP